MMPVRKMPFENYSKSHAKACISSLQHIMSTSYYRRYTIASSKLSLLPISDQQSDDPIVASLGIKNASIEARGQQAEVHDQKRLAGDEKTYEARVAIMTDTKLLIRE